MKGKRLRGDAAARKVMMMRLRVMRHRAGLTQRQLALAAGIGVKNYASRECIAGVHRLSVHELEILTHACGITVAEFMALQPSIAECVSLNLDAEFWPPAHRIT